MNISKQALNKSNKIGTLNEKPLHEALKQWYAQSSDRFEVSVDGFVIDIVRGDLLIEIQTGNLASIKRKLQRLIANHPVRLVYPIPGEKWIIKQVDNQLSRRKSPKQGSFLDVFEVLVSIPDLFINPNFSIELLLIQEEELCRYDGLHGWRRHGWVTQERRLLQVVGQLILKTVADVYALIPSSLSEPFTTADLADAITKSRRLAQKIVYCLRLMGCIAPVGKCSNAILYTRTNS